MSILQVGTLYKFSSPIVNAIALKLYTEINHITGNYHWDNEQICADLSQFDVADIKRTLGFFFFLSLFFACG